MVDSFQKNGETGAVRRSFLSGATRPSLVSVVIAVCIPPFLAALIGLFVTEKYVGGDGYQILMAHEFDSQAMVSHRALSMQATTDPFVAILGTSVTMLCVASEDVVADRVQAQTGTRPVVHDLITSAQTGWEMAALVGRIPDGSHGVLVIGLTPGVFAYGIDDEQHSSLTKITRTPKLGFTSPALDAEAERAGITTPRRSGIYALDNAHFLASRRNSALRNLFKGGSVYADPITAPWMAAVNKQSFWDDEISGLQDRLDRYTLNNALHFDVISRFVDRLNQKSDFKIIVLESPVNPGLHDLPVGRQYYEQFRHDLESYANVHGHSFLSASESAHLQKSDFIDYEGHIGNTNARAQCTDAVSKAIAVELMK